MRENKRKLGLVPKLIIAIVLGILIGQFLPEGFCRLVVTLSGLFSTFLKFVIPLMILAYVTMGIADLSQGAGKLLLITVAIAYGSTLIAGTASFLVADNLFPSFMSAGGTGADRGNRRCFFKFLFFHFTGTGIRYPVRSGTGFRSRTLPVYHERKRVGKQPL